MLKKNDRFFVTDAEMTVEGAMDVASFFTREALTDSVLWAKFVRVFRTQPDGERLAWRGEYWGKMMRGAAMIYACTRDPKLYATMTETVRDLLTVAEADGRVSSYSRETEFDGWDMWCRKYVLLGLQYYYEVCTDEALKCDVVRFMQGCADYVLSFIGDGEGKRTVLQTGRSWGGLNSSSILEPIVRLYAITGEERYLDFASHIVRQGGSSMANIFEMACENKLYPYQYGISKAYEMISNFEGLLEYAIVTGQEKYVTATVNFAKALIASDVSVIGSLGATHELLDHAKNRQTAYSDVVRQETCVTVTWMKFCARLLRLTGDPAFADELEISYYNAYRGALNTEHKTYPKYLHDKCIVRLGLDSYVDTFLPVDSYSPLTPETRGVQVGGLQMLDDGTYYGCCACISPAGVGSFLSSAVMSDEESVVVNFFEKGTYRFHCHGGALHVIVDSEYPVNGRFRVMIDRFGSTTKRCKIRIPAWAESFSVKGSHAMEGGYAIVNLTSDRTEIAVELALRLRTLKPIEWERDLVYTDRSLTTKEAYLAGPMEIEHRAEDDAFVCLMRGPITLAADSRTGKAADSRFTFRYAEGEPIYRLSDEKCLPDVKPLLHCVLTDAEGGEFSLVDYGSAGRDWETLITAWLPV